MSLWRLPALRNLVYLCLLAFTSFFLTLSSLPLYSIQIGTTRSAAGLVTTVMLVSTVAAQTVVPVVVGRFGLSRVLSAGLVLLGGPAPLYVVGRHLWSVLLVSAVRGLGFAIVTVLLPLVAGLLAPPGRRGEAIGVYGLAIAIPNLAGVPLGVALTAAGGFRWVAFGAAAPLLALPLARSVGRTLRSAVTADESAPGPARATPPVKSSGSAVRRVLGAVLVLLVVTLAGGGVLTFLPVARPTGALAGVALLMFGATGALGRWRAGVLSDRLGDRLLLPISVVVAAAGLIVLAVGLALPDTALLLLGSAVLGLGYGSVQNITLLVAFSRAGPAHQTTASAVWNAGYDSGTAIGALLVGMIAAAGPGFPLTFAGCAVLILAGLPLAITQTRPSARTG